MFTKQDVINYLEKKLCCFNKAAIKREGFVIKILMDKKLFDAIEDEIDFEKPGVCLDPGQKGGWYKNCIIFRHDRDGEAVFAIIDKHKFIIDSVKTYI